MKTQMVALLVVLIGASSALIQSPVAAEPSQAEVDSCLDDLEIAYAKMGARREVLNLGEAVKAHAVNIAAESLRGVSARYYLVKVMGLDTLDQERLTNRCQEQMVSFKEGKRSVQSCNIFELDETFFNALKSRQALAQVIQLKEACALFTTA